MKRSFYIITAIMTWWMSGTAVSAQTSFMDLWCEYGGKGCEGYVPKPDLPKKPQPAPPVVPVAKPQASAQKTVVKQTAQPLIRRNASTVKSQGLTFGHYYAVVIGNNRYPHFDDLKTAVGDAREVARLLRQSYGFSVTELINVTRDDIIATLDEYRKILKKNDNLLIYYAGHGWLDKESERGYWLPVDAEKHTRSRWVSNADITDTLKALKAKHVLVVADSCYSGTLTRGDEPQMRGLKLTERPAGYLENLIGRKSRTVLSSGALEPVTDQGGGKHSVFAYAFLKSLQENKEMIDGTQLFGNVRTQVLLNARQTPQYSNIRFAGHDVGGDFVFLRRDK